MIDLQKSTLADILTALKNGDFTASELTAAYLERIAQLNGRHNAVLEINLDALATAAAVDQRAVHGGLDGVPILLKDNINTADAMHTSAGSVALKNRHAPEDAAVTERLRAVGAVILGKANMTEFANAMASRMPNGYSSRGRQVKGISKAVKDPAGSSTGSAVAVAMGLCAAAIGTETCGSIIGPSWVAGIVGFKPTAGLVSRRGILPISRTLDTAGPMARTAFDALLLLAAIAGKDERDEQTLCQPLGCLRDPGPVRLEGLRIGVSHSFMDQCDEDEQEGLPMAQALLPKLADAGAVLIDTDIPAVTPGELSPGALFGSIFRYEMKASVNAYFAQTGEQTTLKDIIKYNKKHPKSALKYGQDVLERAEAATGTLTEPEYLNALVWRERWIARIDALFADNDLDIMLSIPPILTAPVLGFPAMTLPIGHNSQGVPVGSYWMGPRFSDMYMLRIGEALENVIGRGDKS